MAARFNPSQHVKFGIYLLVVLLINIASMTLFFRFDLTADKIYSISKASHKVVATLKEPLTINVFFTKNLPAPHNGTERYLRDLLAEYAAQGNRYFNYRFYDVSTEEGDTNAEAAKNRKLAEDYGIYPLQIQAIEKDEVKFQKAYMGLVILHGDLIERIGSITSTEGLEYKLTSAITKLNNKISALLSLKEKIGVTLYLSKSLETVAPYMQIKDLAALPKKIEKVVQKLNQKTYDKIKYDYQAPEAAANPDAFEQLARKYDLISLKWPAMPKGNIKAGRGIIGMVLSHGQNSKTIPLLRVMNLPIIGTHYELTDPARLEDMLTGAIETLIDINEDIGYLTDNGTPSIWRRRPVEGQPPETITLQVFNHLVSQNYTVKPVSLETGIPESINCLIIARPTEKFSDYDLFLIDQFLMRGKSLALFINAFNEINLQGSRMNFMSRGPQWIPIDSGLEKLLDHYGISIEPAITLDENCYRQQVPPRMGGGEQSIYFAPLIQNQDINDKLDFMKNLRGLIGFKMSPLALDDKRIKQNGLKAYRLFASSDKSWQMKGRINLNPMTMGPPPTDQKRESLALAYLIEGSFPSYFDGKPLPQKPQKEDDKGEKKDEQDKADKEKPAAKKEMPKIEGSGKMITRGKPAKLFLMASADMISDTVLDGQGRTPNSIFIMNVLDELNNRGEIAVMRSKNQRINPLDQTSGTVKATVKSINIIGLPVLVVLFGLLMWFHRKSRKKRIQSMFISSTQG